MPDFTLILKKVTKEIRLSQDYYSFKGKRNYRVEKS